MKRLNMDTLGISETIWIGNGRIKVGEGYEMIFAREDRHEHGMELLMHTKMSNKISAVISKSGGDCTHRSVLEIELEIGLIIFL